MARRKWTIPQGCEALKKHCGNVTYAAEALGIHRSTLSHAIKRSPKLRKARREGEDSVVEMAEGALYKLIREGNVIATLFTLKCQGKKKGWIEKDTESSNKEEKLAGAVADLASLVKDKI